ncbi:unnamed protein product [Cuscuta europaea]|uniref:Uncharacterized protein n=1 Tax=Cuscuta europaea TaxID=41803 RepID=A0A9P1E621_CUSEU|nr:unnamed protein product [Cuscuta europaea]
MMSWNWISGGAASFLDQINLEFQSKRKELVERMIWGCWALWCERNHRVWQGVPSSVQRIIQRAEASVIVWKEVQGARIVRGQRGYQAVVAWRRPHPGKLKLNVDDVVRPGCCGVGWCLRDDTDRFVAGVA